MRSTRRELFEYITTQDAINGEIATVLVGILGLMEFQEELIEELYHRLDRCCPHRITHFTIRRSNMQPIAPGFSPQFTATPQPTGTVLNPVQPVPTWTSLDPTNAPVSVDSTGLVATVAIPAGATVGAQFTLTINFTNADGKQATGTFDGTIVAPPPMDITSFTIAQTA